MGFGLAWTTIDIDEPVLKFVIAGVALIETASLCGVLNYAGIQWSPVASLLAGILGTAFGYGFTRSIDGKRRLLIEQMFAGRISEETMQKLEVSTLPIDFAGERREASVVVCEIFNHQLLSDALPPGDFVALSNAFIRAGSEVLMDAGAMMDQSNGYNVRAIFGTPLEDPDHAEHACRAAYVLGRRMEKFCLEAIERWKAAPDYRIAINSGEMISAAYGAPTLGSFTVTGEPLEFCRRLCAANTLYGSRILVGPRAFQLANAAVEVRPIELVRRRGTATAPAENYEIYELLAPKNQLTRQEAERRDLFWMGVVLFRERRWDEATMHFEAALRDAGCEDGPARFYLNRIAHARAGANALDWDSVNR